LSVEALGEPYVPSAAPAVRGIFKPSCG